MIRTASGMLTRRPSDTTREVHAAVSMNGKPPSEEPKRIRPTTGLTSLTYSNAMHPPTRPCNLQSDASLTLCAEAGKLRLTLALRALLLLLAPARLCSHLLRVLLEDVLKLTGLREPGLFLAPRFNHAIALLLVEQPYRVSSSLGKLGLRLARNSSLDCLAFE
eukprot:CAMPEP_0119371804 /NCGR_PEP_ID=MMETSP1334-20130426/17906_1 /TAXON_ID=127549 /ORGANISM="Calcidiscus leptoporus, Strain RCC1130" /LENGTH=162 /DNA_ID=CAMNT_0007389155 /DNA_START=211 /DNA_END=699 /DNA_ORIENTATION=-